MMASALKTLATRCPPALPRAARVCFVRGHHGLAGAGRLAVQPQNQNQPLRPARCFASAAPQTSASTKTPPAPTTAPAPTTVSDSTAVPAPAAGAAPPTSSAAAPAASSASSVSSVSSVPSASSEPAALDWNSFFRLRLRRRRFQIGFSVASGLFCGVGGALLLATGLAEPLVTHIPLDPIITFGLIVVACAGMGWLAGPSIGSQVFYLFNRPLKAQMMNKESEFFARVRKNRVDPSNSSAGNPVPDFYGEKIQSVAGYRQWLKDQRAFNKKKTANFV